MNDSAELLNELLEVARDSERFYDAAAREVRNDELRSVFRQQSALRRTLMDVLVEHVTARGIDASSSVTLAGRARQTYAAALAALGDEDAAYVAQLEEAEDRLLAHYRKALEQCGDRSVRAVLQRQLPSVEAAHRRMQRLKAISRQPDRASA